MILSKISNIKRKEETRMMHQERPLGMCLSTDLIALTKMSWMGELKSWDSYSIKKIKLTN